MLAKLNEISHAESLDVSEEASQSIVQLSGGDMRKVLNVLESCALAHETITIANVYEVTGRPSPDDIDIIYEALTMEKFDKAMAAFMELKTRKSLSLDDVLGDLH